MLYKNILNLFCDKNRLPKYKKLTILKFLNFLNMDKLQ